MERLRVGGVTLAYDVRGDGPPLVLLHGLGERAASWENVRDALAAALFAAVAQVGVRRLTRTEPSSRIVFYFGVISTAVSALPLVREWRMPAPPLWLTLIALGAQTVVNGHQPTLRVGGGPGCSRNGAEPGGSNANKAPMRPPRALFALFLGICASPALAAEPALMTEAQMDNVTAGSLIDASQQKMKCAKAPVRARRSRAAASSRRRK